MGRLRVLYSFPIRSVGKPRPQTFLDTVNLRGTVIFTINSAEGRLDVRRTRLELVLEESYYKCTIFILSFNNSATNLLWHLSALPSEQSIHIVSPFFNSFL